MRSLKIALAIVAVLALTGTTYAVPAATSVMRTPGFQSDVLDSWTVMITGANAFSNINILNMAQTAPAVVHQVNMFSGTPKKPRKTIWTDSDDISADSAAFDTHFLFASADVLAVGSTTVETNSKTGPFGLNYADADMFYYGLGTFASGPTDGFSLGAATAVGTPFMQIVLPKGQGAWLTGVASVGGENAAIQQFVPEPGTIALLIGGALCLVAVRFRKK